MSSMTIVGGAALGIAVGLLLVPLTRRELAGAVARTSDSSSIDEVAPPAPVRAWEWAALGAVSGILPAYVLHKVGWSLIAFPPLLLLVGLIQLGYCDLTRRLLPKTMVYALSAAVIVSGVVIAGVMHEWGRLEVACIGGAAFFTLFFIMNLLNPRWLAFGDVRLSLVVGFGLAWVSWMALFEGFFFANLVASIVGLGLMALHRAGRRTAVPFGLYLAIGTALVLVTWS
ncbi:MAG TPA: A24 family peptidase [Acidimicrobiales bacterium]|jgi:leader peptidase (prepilin peptidase)/N-methyltransferase